MTEAPNRARHLRTVWIVFWLFAGTVHLTEAIWGSGFTALPAGLGDGRFNHLVLEHGYLSLRGVYEWTSPGQFYSIPDTLGWSDTHLGTLPLYILPRLLGIAPERALQVWFLACAALNLLCGYRLVRVLGLDAWWGAPVAFAAFASVPLVWMTGIHPQMLPIFPALLAWAEAIRFGQERRGWRLFTTAGALAGQFAAGPYLAFFAGLVGGLLVMVWWLSRSPEWRRTPTPENAARCSIRTVAMGSTLAALGLATGAVNLWIYLTAFQNGMGRPMQELIELAPRWSSWFSAPPILVWYPIAWPAGSGEHSEHVLFGGFGPWLLGLVAMVGWLRSSLDGRRRQARLCATVAFGTMLFFLMWPGGFSPWLVISEWIEPLRAFRAAGRVAILVHGLLVLASGMLLFSWWNEGRRRLAVMVAVLLVGEGLATGQPRYTIADAQARRNAVVTAWKAAGDHPVLAFAPGFTNQPQPELNLDAWAAALATHRVTLNGFTGGAPATHLPFIWSPTEANAGGLANLMRIPPDQLSLVTGFPPETAAAIGYEFHEARPLQHLDGYAVQPFAWTLFSPLERYVYDDGVYYQFTPPATVSFVVPDSATAVAWHTGLRPGSYDHGGDSDGYTLTWRVLDAADNELSREEEFINPRDEPDQRGLQARTAMLPAGANRRIVFEFGMGPSGISNWDWPLLGRLEFR